MTDEEEAKRKRDDGQFAVRRVCRQVVLAAFRGMHLHATAAALWLIGVGSLLAVLPRLLSPDRPELGLPWESMASRALRLHFACETIGMLIVAAGSLLLAITSLGPWWFDLSVLAMAAVGVLFLSAWKLRQLWKMRATHATAYRQGGQPPMSEEQQREVALNNARWSTCIARSFARTASWEPVKPEVPTDTADIGARLEPRHIAELHERDARLEDAHIPLAILQDARRIREQGFRIKVVGDSVIATAPDGRTAQVSRDGVSKNSPGAVLHRDRWLNELSELGLDVHAGLKGLLVDEGTT